MDFEKTFPLCYWINLARRADRRAETEWQMARAGIPAERFPAVDARFVGKMALERNKPPLKEFVPENEISTDEAPESRFPPPVIRGYESAGRYALALTQRLAIRRAWLKNAEAVLLFEDDVILHPNFKSLIRGLEIPDDWGIFFLGCQHTAAPVPLGPGIVRVRHGIDTHAVAIRRPYYRKVMAALDAHGKPTPDHPLASDRFLAALASEIPTYACFPNLAWQANEKSDLIGETYTLYQKGGTQKHGYGFIERTFEKMAGVAPASADGPDTKLGLLFLTRADVHHPQIWLEFINECSEQVRIFSHPKVPDHQKGGFLDGSMIEERHETAWGSISLVKASLALLRRALEDESLTHFVLLSESCVPILPLSEMLRRLRANPRSRFGWRTLDECWELQKIRAARLPQVPEGCWRFQSQWWLMERMAAEWVARTDYTDIFAGMPIPDEAYFATVLSLLGYPVDDLVMNKDITWTWWEKDQGSPTSFLKVEIATVREMIESSAWFARKFPPGSDIAKWRLHQAWQRPRPEDGQTASA